MIARATSGAGILDGPIWKDFGLEAEPGDVVVEAVQPIPEAIGRYRILRVIGEGGMGVVYEAEQDQPRRHVALKVIRPGLASAQILRRFDRESQALARLHHVGIAQIYEAGSAETSHEPQPYFAMEFIHGTPLRQYVDSKHLGTNERLEIMAKICEAVEHAHQNGIIHRDLKPGNILVDETGQPKILDFGVARLTDCDAQVTKQTDLGQLVGTLAYMSPEQVLGDTGQLDSRSDVYALGVILYELLAQRLPYEISDKLYEAVRTIREEDPKRLSSISRTFRGDVETIVSKALEKDKARRYTSAAAMEGDIRKYLADEPITARPASAAYQLRKFAQRNKTLVGAAAVVFAVLVAGVVVSTSEAVRAGRAERMSEAVNDFLENDLLAQASASTQASPSTRPDPHLEVRTALDRAAAKIGGKFDQQPEVEAAIRDTIGRTYLDLGLYPEARSQLERALDLRRRVLGARDPKTLKSISDLGTAILRQGKFPEAEVLLNQAVAIQRRVLGPEHPDTLISMLRLALIYDDEANYMQAEALDRQILEIQHRVLGAENPDTLTTMANLADVYDEEGKYPQAEALNTQTLGIRRRVLGLEHPGTLMTMANLAVVYTDEGKYAQAEVLNTQTLEIRRRVLGPEHPDTLSSMLNLAVDYDDEGKYAQAERLYTKNLEIRHRLLGPEHPDTVMTMDDLANVYNDEGKYAQAESLYTQNLEIRRRVLGPEHLETLRSMNNLAVCYGSQGRYAQANALLNQSLAIARRVLGPEHPMTLTFLSTSAFVYQHQGKHGVAETYAAQALTGRQHALGHEHLDTMDSAADLVLAYVSQGKFTEAEPLAREALETEKKVQPDDWQRYRAASLLGASLAGQKKYAEAEPLLLEGFQGMLERKDRIAVPDRYHLDRAHQWLVQLYRVWRKPEKAAEWRKK